MAFTYKRNRNSNSNSGSSVKSGFTYIRDKNKRAEHRAQQEAAAKAEREAQYGMVRGGLLGRTEDGFDIGTLSRDNMKTVRAGAQAAKEVSKTSNPLSPKNRQMVVNNRTNEILLENWKNSDAGRYLDTVSRYQSPESPNTDVPADIQAEIDRKVKEKSAVIYGSSDKAITPDRIEREIAKIEMPGDNQSGTDIAVPSDIQAEIDRKVKEKSADIYGSSDMSVMPEHKTDYEKTNEKIESFVPEDLKIALKNAEKTVEVLGATKNAYGLNDEANAKYEKAVQDLEYLKGVYNRMNIPSNELPETLNQKYSDYVGEGAERVAQTQIFNINRGQASADSDIAKAVLHPKPLPETSGESLQYIFDTDSAEYNAAKMTNLERNTYFAIMAKEGTAAADAFYKELEPYLKERRNNEFSHITAEIASNASWFEKAVLTGGEIANVALSPIDFASKVLGDGASGVSNFADGLETATNSIAQDISKDSELGAWAYQLGISGGKSLLSLGLTGGTESAVQLLMGADAATAAMNDAERRGLDRTQSLIYGISIGAIEGFTEKIGLDALLGNPQKTIGYILKNMAAEGTEEALSEVLGNVADVIINTDDSVFIQNTKNYVQNGMSEKQAFGNAVLDVLADTVKAAAGGAIIGGSFAGGNTIINGLGNFSAQKQYDNVVGDAILNSDTASDEIRALIDSANESQNKDLLKTAQKVENSKYNFGELGENYTAPAQDVGKLARLSERQRQQDVLDAVALSDTQRQAYITELTNSGMNQRYAQKLYSEIEKGVRTGDVDLKLQTVLDSNDTALSVFNKLSEYVSPKAAMQRLKEATGYDIGSETAKEYIAGEDIDIDERPIEMDNPVAVTGKDSRGNLIIRTESGTEISYDENSNTINDSYRKKLNYAKLYGTEGASAYFSLSPDNRSAAFDADFENLYTQGKNSREFSALQNSSISPDVQRVIYESGKADLNNAAALSRRMAEQARQREAAFIKKQIGFKSDRVTITDAAVSAIKNTKDSSLREQYNASAAVIDALANMMQVDIVVTASETDAEGNYISPNGTYNPETNSFTFDILAGMNNVNDVTYSAMLKTAGHELTHFIQNWSPSKYLKLKNNVLRFLTKQNGDAWVRERLDEIISSNANIGSELTLEQARDELVADSFENVLSEVDFAETVLRTDKSLFDKVHRWVKDHIANFKKHLSRSLKHVGAQTAAGKTMQSAGKKALAIYNEWADAFVTALENSTSRESGDDSSDVKNQAKNNKNRNTIIDLSNDNELSARIGDKRGSDRHKTIRDYILEVLNEQPITLSDGKKAIVDNRDAQHIARFSSNVRISIVAEIKKIISSATLYAEDTAVEHNKFDYFCYYRADVKYKDEVLELYLNVGRGKNDGKYHIYDITNKIRNTADRINGLWRPKPNEGYAIRNGVSYINSIPQNGENVNNKLDDKKSQNQARRIDTPLDVVTRRELADVLDEHANTLSGAKKAKLKVTLTAYKEAVDAYNNAVLDLRVAQNNGSKEAITLAKAAVALRESAVKSIEKNKALLDGVKELGENSKHFAETLHPPKNATSLFTKKSVDNAAARLMAYSGAKGEKSELSSMLNSFYENIAHSEQLDWDDVVKKSAPVVEWLHQHQDFRVSPDETAKDIRKYIRSQRVYLTEGQKSEVAHTYGSYNAFRKAAMGKIIISNNATQTLETLWRDLSGMYPDYFERDVKDAEIPHKLLETFNSLNSNKFEHEAKTEYEAHKDELTNDFIREIFNSYWDVSTRHKSLDYGKYETLMEDARAMIMNLREQLTDAERAARESARKAEIADFHARSTSLRNKRDMYLSRLGTLRNRLKQAIEKPTERASLPKGGEDLARSIFEVTGTLNELLRTDVAVRSNDELITRITNTAMATANGSKSFRGTQVEPINRMLRESDALRAQLGRELSVLLKEYQKIEELPTVELAFTKELAQRLTEYIAESNEKYYGEEMLDHLADGISLMKAIGHRLMSANRAMVAGKWINIIELRDNLSEDAKNAPNVPYKVLNKFSYALTPKTMMHLSFGATENSDTLYSIYNDAQTKYMRYNVGAKDIFKHLDDATRKGKINTTEAKIRTGLKDTDGNEVLLNPDLAISFVLASENEDYLRHMVWGGFQLPDLKKLYSTKSADAYVDNRFTEHLTAEKHIKDYVGDMFTEENIRAALDRIEKQEELTDDDFIIYQAKLEFDANGNTAAEAEMKQKYRDAAKLIKSQLDSTSLEWLNAIRNYYNGFAKQHLDEATMERYGYTKTLSSLNRYYPIHVVKSQVGIEQNDLMKYDATLESLGSMKSRKKSKAGVQLFGAISSLNNQIEQTAIYYGWINAIDTIKKTLNSKIELDNGDVTTLVEYVSKHRGNEKFKGYLNELENEISGKGKKTTDLERITEFLHSAFVASALSFNLSPALKQTSALPLVAAESGYISFARGLGKGVFESNGDRWKPILTKAQMNYISNYSLVYKYRSGGMLDIDLAALKNTSNPISKFMQKYPYATGVAWPEFVDAQVLGFQFYALRDMVQKAHPDWDSEKINVEAGKQLDKTIQNFQANYTVLQRAPILRGKGPLKLIFGTFKTQQITMLNAQIDSVLRVQTLNKQLETGYGDTAKLKADLHKAKLYAGKVAAASAGSYLLNAVLAMGISILYRRKEWDDESLIKDAGWDILQSYMSMLPFVGDLAYRVAERFAGNGYYGDSLGELGSVQMLGDALDAFDDVIEKMSEGELTLDRIAKDFGKIVAPLGIPFRNAYNIVKAFLEWCGIEIE